VRTLPEISPIVIAAYIENHPGAAPTVKQHFAAIRMLFAFSRHRADRSYEPGRVGARAEARGPSWKNARPESRPSADTARL
jgi:hypothetical protein